MDLSIFNLISTAWAQDAGASAAPGGGSPMTMLIWMGVVVVIFWFLILRPQQKQQKQRMQMLNDLKRGDEVVTNGGIYGKIVEIKDDGIVMLQVANNVTLKFDRNQIGLVSGEKLPEEKK